MLAVLVGSMVVDGGALILPVRQYRAVRQVAGRLTCLGLADGATAPAEQLLEHFRRQLD